MEILNMKTNEQREREKNLQIIRNQIHSRTAQDERRNSKKKEKKLL